MTLRTARLPLALVAALIAGCTVELQHDLEEDDANDIYVLLQNNGIEAKKHKDEGGNEPRYVISVPKGDVADAAKLLRDHSLPRPKADGLAVFKKSKGMIPTQTEERAMFIEALGGEVSNALNRVPGVLEARTIVMLPEVNDLTQPDQKPQPSASVFVKYREGLDGKPPLNEDQVRAFVASAVPELNEKRVTVLMTKAVPPEADPGAEPRIQSVLGLQMVKTSALRFKVMVAVAGLLVLAMAGFTTWTFARSGAQRPRPRGRSPEA